MLTCARTKFLKIAHAESKCQLDLCFIAVCSSLFSMLAIAPLPTCARTCVLSDLVNFAQPRAVVGLLHTRSVMLASAELPT